MPGHGVVILAAGGSTRMGSPKQLLEMQGQSLLSRAIATAVESKAETIAVVLGAEAERMTAQVKGDCVRMAVNGRWSSGIGSSIRLGVETLLQASPLLDTLILCLCDQPHVTAAHLQELVARTRGSGRPICAAAYAGTLGTPCCFTSAVFPELLGLSDAQGGKVIIVRNPDRVASIPLPEAEIDVDTPVDYARLSGGT